VVSRTGLYCPYRLFSITKTTGAFQAAAMLSDSWNVPMLVAPSPQNARATASVPRKTADMAAPTAME
jgi:hypothetical protein